MTLKLPPYGVRLHRYLQSGQNPNNDILICMGERAWKMADIFGKNKFILCLPKNCDPFSFQWPIQDCDILIYDSDEPDEDSIHLFVACLFSYGANIVRYHSHDFKLTIFKKEL